MGGREVGRPALRRLLIFGKVSHEFTLLERGETRGFQFRGFRDDGGSLGFVLRKSEFVVWLETGSREVGSPALSRGLIFGKVSHEFTLLERAQTCDFQFRGFRDADQSLGFIFRQSGLVLRM